MSEGQGIAKRLTKLSSFDAANLYKYSIRSKLFDSFLSNGCKFYLFCNSRIKNNAYICKIKAIIGNKYKIKWLRL